MKLAGHKTEVIYRRYAIVSEADLSEGVKKLTVLSTGQAGEQTAKVVPFSSGTDKAGASRRRFRGEWREGELATA